MTLSLMKKRECPPMALPSRIDVGREGLLLAVKQTHAVLSPVSEFDPNSDIQH